MEESKTEKYSRLIREEALRLGFFSCGYSKADFLEKEAPRLEQWLTGQRHGRMAYMERHFDLRLDPRKLVPGARTVVSLLYNYFPEQVIGQEGVPRISRYAYGEDYHRVVKDKLFELLIFIRDNVGDVEGRAFVDSAPVMEKAWAANAGLGWVGKNGNLITKGAGSYFFLAELIIDLDLTPDAAVEDYCGTCTRCIDACPTDAIIKPQVVDGSRCISYFTIELKEEIPTYMAGTFGDWVFGCDVCQEVCPWNRFSKPTQEQRFKPREEWTQWSEKEWEEITEETFGRIFRNSPLQRTGYQGLVRTLNFRKKNV
jgi:epoxyqueuosine reductase